MRGNRIERKPPITEAALKLMTSEDLIFIVPDQSYCVV